MKKSQYIIRLFIKAFMLKSQTSVAVWFHFKTIKSKNQTERFVFHIFEMRALVQESFLPC